MAKRKATSGKKMGESVTLSLSGDVPSRSREKASRFALLGMLSLGTAQSGYDLKKALATTTANFWNESYGNIYPTLRRLVEEGLIRPHKQRSRETGRRKQLYSITARGKRALSAWLQQPVAARTEDNELLLKLFFASAMPIEAAKQLVSSHLDEHERLLENFAAVEKDIADGPLEEDQKTYIRATVEYGRAVSQALAAWAETTIATLERLQSAGRSRSRVSKE